MTYFSKCLTILFLALVSICARGQELNFSEAPEYYQLYARDKTDSAEVRFSGNLAKGAAVSALQLKVFKDDVLYDRQKVPVAGNNFSIGARIQAGLHSYRFELYVQKNQEDSLYLMVDSVVCGDAYIITGQSNSHPSSTLSTFSSPFCRSFGVKTGYEPYTEEDKQVRWARASGNCPGLNREVGGWFIKNPYGVGVWGMELMKLLVEKYQVPVCIINGGSGSSSIEQNMLYPERPSLETSFGRLAYRVDQAGLKDKIKAIFWHQGETNTNTVEGYQSYPANFETLMADWKRVYTGLEKIYLFQLHPGCGRQDEGYYNELREIQTQLAEKHEMVEIMSTNGVSGHDGCHFSYQGYLEFAQRIFPLTARDFYGTPSTYTITPPKLLQAHYISENEIALTFDQAVSVEESRKVNGATHFLKDQFAFKNELDGAFGPATVKSLKAVGNELILALEKAGDYRYVTYLPSKFYPGTKEIYNGPWLRGGENQLGALSFHQRPIRPRESPATDGRDGANTQKPNIIIIYTDDQGYGDVGALNPDAKFRTPNMDRIAQEGVIFTDGHSSDAVCTPSRYSLLTGRYSWRTSLKKGVLEADGPCLIEDDRMTIASLLKENGYHTAMIGKWHLQMEFAGERGKDRNWSAPFSGGPVDHGFDYFFGIPASMNYGILTYLENDKVLDPPLLWTKKKEVSDPRSFRDQARPNDYRMTPPYQPTPGAGGGWIEVAPSFNDELVLETFADKAVDYIHKAAKEAKNGKPFFLYLPLTSPHLPHCTHPDFKGRSQCGNYGDFMEETDYRVGQILAALQANGIADNTLVIFSSDNGAETNYEYHREIYEHHSSLHFKGGKRDIYEGGHRVPYLMRWPAVIKAGSKIDLPVCQTDYLATIAEIVGVKLPENAGEDSYSLLPALKGESYDHSLRGPVIHHSVSGHFAIRYGKWKLNMFRGSGGSLKPAFIDPQPGEPPLELYDLEADPSETNNLYAEYPEIVDRLKEKITAIIANGRSTPGEPQDYVKTNWNQLNWMETAGTDEKK